MLIKLGGLKAAAFCCCFLALAACSKKSTPNLEASNGIGSYAPGSVAEFQKGVGDTVFFLVDQSMLTTEGKETLVRQAQWLKQYGEVTVQVEGHADERGTREYNIALSARRATTTRQFLISQGVSAERMSTIAYGKERPAALCDAEQCWSQNRRSVTVITGGAKTS
jgi:peptidoglycan-associated lipoprotein